MLPRRYPAALLFTFAALPLCAQVAQRPLNTAFDAVHDSTPVYLHTEDAFGTAIYSPANGEVLAALHTVLNPQHRVPAHIVMGLRQQPLNNIVELPLRAVAEDPAHDLILLRTVAAVPAAESAPAPAVAADAQVETPASERPGRHATHARHSRSRRHHAARRTRRSR